MAKVKFTWSPKGYVEVLNSAGVQSMVDAEASRQQTKLNSTLSPDGYTSTQNFKKAPYKGKYGRRGKVVYANTVHAQRHCKRKGIGG